MDWEIAEDLEASMRLLMKGYEGAGLAANQVGFSYRMFIVDESIDPDHTVFINPVVTPLNAGTSRYREGCLSVPGTQIRLARPKKVLVKAQRTDGSFFEIKADKLLARVIQHEMDHLEGVVLLDRASRTQLERLRRHL